MAMNKAFNSAALRKGLETRGTDAPTEWQISIGPQSSAFDAALTLPADAASLPNPETLDSEMLANDISSGTEALLSGDPGPLSGHLQSVPGGVDVAIIGYNTGQSLSAPATSDRFYFVLLNPVASGTQIFFTDRSWNGTAFAAAGGGDGTFTFTAASNLAAGTVIHVTQANLTAAGMDLDHSSGDAIYVYQGAINAPTQFLYALELGDGNTTFNGNLTNTGLTNGFTAVSVAHDAASYHGPTTHAESFLWNGAGSTLLHSISDASNWVGDDADGANAKEQEIQDGPWLTHADVEFWGTFQGGGSGLANTLRDSTHVSGNDDYNHSRLYDAGSSSNSAIIGQFFNLRDMVFDTVDGKFFLVDSDISGGNNRILQGNIADLLANPTALPTLTVLYSDTGTTTDARLDNLDVDIANNIIYFTHGDELRKINYDTAGQLGTLLFRADVTNITSPSGIANPAGSTNNFYNDMVINFATGKIYLSSTRVLAGAGGDTISKNFIYELSGLTTGSGTDAFQFNATNTGTARLLPFVDNDDAFNPIGGTTSSPATAANQAYFWAQERGTLDGLAIDPVNNILYFSTGEILFDHDGSSGTSPFYQGGVIASYALAGNPTGIATILHQQNVQFGGAIPGLMGDLEVDLANGHLYVLDYAGINGVNDDNHWFRMNIGGSTPIQFTQTIGDLQGAATVGLTLNHAPTLTGTPGASLAVTEASSNPLSGTTAAVTLFTNITIADVDTSTADEITGAVVRIGEGFTFEAASTAGGHGATVDFLRINGNTSGTIAGSGINFSYNSSTGAMVLTGAATVAEYKAAIELVQFSTSGDNVTNNGNSTSRTIYVSVSDGLTMSDEISAVVTVTGINDRPVNTVGAAMNFTEDTVGTAGVPAPPPAPVNAITGLSIADADADATTDLFTVTLTVANGTLNIRTDVVNGVTAGNVTGNGTASIVLTGTQNQINNTLAAVNNAAAANGLVYTPNANFNGADTLTMVTNDQGNSGNDPGQTGTGTTEEDSDTKTLNVADVNDAPTVAGDGTEQATDILEDIPSAAGQSVASLFGGQFSDALDVQVSGGNPTGSPGDTLAGIAITANGSSVGTGQWQYFNGSIWVDIGAATVDAAKTISAVTAIRFNPALNFNGPAPTLTAHLIETGGPAITNGATVDLNPAPPTTGPTAVYSSATVVLSQNVLSVNDAPTQTNLFGDTRIWLEGSVAVTLDVGTNATIADVDSANFDTGTLTVAITAGGVPAEDVLAVINQGNGAGQIGVSGLNISFGGVQFATLNAGGGTAGNPLVFTFDSDATPAAVQALVRNITYANSGGEDPTDGDRTITWTLVDGDGTLNGGVDTLSGTTTVDVDPVNDPPSGTDSNRTALEDTTFVFVSAGPQTFFPFSDPLDNDSFIGVFISSLATAGTLLYDADGFGSGAAAVPVTINQFISSGDFVFGRLGFQPAANQSGSPYATFTFQVRDSGGTLDGGVDTDQTPNIFTFNVTPVNDAPAIGALDTNNVAFTEGDLPVRLDAGINATVTDIDSANFDGGSLSLTFNIQPGDAVGFDPGGGVTVNLFNGEVSVDDGGGPVVVGIASFIANGVTIAFDADATPARVQQIIRAAIYQNVSTNPSTVTRTFTWTLNDGDGNANGGDPDTVVTSTVTVASVNDEPSGADNEVTTTVNTDYVFGTADFGFTDPNDAPPNALLNVIITTLPALGTLELNNVAVTAGQSVSATDIAAGLLTFTPGLGDSGDDYTTFTFQVQDDGGVLNSGVDTDQTPNTITIDVGNNVNPALSVTDTLSYTENDPASIIAPTATLTDGDSPDFDTGTLTVSFTANGTTDDQLAIRNQGTAAGEIGVSGSDVTFSGVVIGTFSGGVNGADLVVTFDADATPAAAEALLRNITYANSSDNPSALPRTVSATVTDGDGGSASGSATINITAVDDPPVAQPDAVATDEANGISGNVFVANPTLADSDVDGPALSVSEVNGSSGDVGVQITLASGALLTLLANGDFDYQPNGAFDRTPTADSGASNTPASDSFTYTLTNGNTATVTITIAGLDSNDFLFGAPGNDTLTGKTGDDIYFVDDSGDVVVERDSEGFDLVFTSASYTLPDHVERLGVNGFTTTFAIALTGNSLDNEIWGNDGPNFLDGGGGADILHGRGNNDVFIVDNSGDVVIEHAGGGFDLVFTSVDYTLSDHVERLGVNGFDTTFAINLTGNSFDNEIWGNDGANVLDGGGGADVLQGRGGDDIYIVDDIGDVVVEHAGGGMDIVFTSADHVLSDHVERLAVNGLTTTFAVDLTGNSLANELIGNDGDNVLDGGAGADLLRGNGGADTFAFTSPLGGGNVDQILDFEVGVDQVALDNAIFSELALGALDPNAFRIGTAAEDADDRIIYDQTTGAVYYDADGNGGGAAVQFATLPTGLANLSAGDFIVV